VPGPLAKHAAQAQHEKGRDRRKQDDVEKLEAVAHKIVRAPGARRRPIALKPSIRAVTFPGA
jgi:hypothetical protein